jgi:hypothetical protein
MHRRALIGLLALAPALAPAQTKEQRDLRIRFQNLAARAVAMNDSYKTMEERLRREGLTLRAETVAARARMEMFLDDAENALKEKRWKEARKAMERAGAAIARLETALGAR